MKVRDTDGTVWSVRRRWLPWRMRTRRLLDGLPDVPASDLLDVPVIGAILFVVLLPLLLLALGILAVVAVELLLLLALLPVVVLVRALVGGWTLVVRRDGAVAGLERVRGWRRSRARIRAIAEEIRTRPANRLVDLSGDPYQLGDAGRS